MNFEKGMIYVISAPSGAGKTTLIQRLMAENPSLRFSVSTTTRPPRPGEVDGVNYHFVESARFQQMVAQGEFLEWAHIHGNMYGTSRAAAQAVLDEGHELLLDVDVQGGHSLRRVFGTHANFIYVVPPSMEVLARRLADRGTESKESLALRLANAKEELKVVDSYDFVVVNDDLDLAYEEFVTIYRACHYRVALRQLAGFQ